MTIRPSGKTYAQWGHGVGIKHPSAIQIVGTPVATLVCESDAYVAIVGGLEAEGGEAGWHGVEGLRCADVRSGAERVVAIPSPGHDACFGGGLEPLFIERLGFDGNLPATVHMPAQPA